MMIDVLLFALGALIGLGVWAVLVLALGKFADRNEDGFSGFDRAAGRGPVLND